MLHLSGRCVFVLVCLIFMLAGCGSGKSGMDSQSPREPQAVFDIQCAKCHAQAGERSGPKLGSSKAPNLTHIGSEPGRTAEWIAKYIRDPKSVLPDSRMPKFEGVIKDEEIRALAEYLAAKK